jgi:hypothetical protein
MERPMVRLFTVLLLTLLTILAAPAIADPAGPQATFGKKGVAITGLTPGAHVAWIGLIAEPRGYHTRLRLTRGFAPAAQSAIEIPEHDADVSRSLWVIADVGNGKGLPARSPQARFSQRPIQIDARVGASTVAIQSGAIELLYVRPPAQAWYLSVSDGADLDADHAQNGVIVVPLSMMTAYRGNPHPPSTAAAGDVILVIDPWRRRTATIQVTP